MNKKRILFASVLGNALEFYDFTLYGVFATVIARLYFPSDNEVISLLASWGAFGTGFLMRPFGAMVFGYIGDKFGRQKALTLSIVLMGVPTLVIGLLPGYATLGVLAPIILICCRLLQGLCTGGEYNGAGIFAIEHMGRNYPGFASGAITGSCVIGAITATAFGSVITGHGDVEWMWRIPFVCGAFVSVIGFYVRRRLTETPVFKALEKEEDFLQSPFDVVQFCGLEFTKAIMLGLCNGVFSYTLFGFMITYLSRYGDIPIAQAMQLNLLGLLAFMVGSPILGHVAEKMGNEKYFAYGGFVGLFSVVPCFLLLQSSSLPAILVGQLILGILTAGIAGPQHYVLVKLFPAKYRYSGASMGFSIGMAAGGGSAPIVLIHLIEKTGNTMVPAYFLGVFCFIATWTLLIDRLPFGASKARHR
ncbi:MAG: MFS transporter [Pseudomonadota bacterium]